MKPGLTILRSVAELALPAPCVGCGTIGSGTWCRRCEQWVAATTPSVTTISGVKIFSAMPYAGPARNIIIANKEHNRRAAGHLMAHHLATTLTSVMPALPDVLIPIPSSRVNRLIRGADPIGVLTKTTALAVGAESRPALWFKKYRPDQSTQGRARRMRNVRDNVAVDTSMLTAGKTVFLVDDLVTTGSTLVAAAQVLTRVGLPCLGAITFAYTPH